MKKLSICLLSLLLTTATYAYNGKIVDAKTQTPIADVIVTLGNDTTRSKADGTFELDGSGEILKFRTPGYAKQEITTDKFDSSSPVTLTPFDVKALYLTGHGLAHQKIRTNALAVIQENNLNALVVDFKGDRGLVPFKIDVPLATEIGAQNQILIKDAPAMIAELKQQNLYLIARIVVFKDDLLASAKPELAVQKNGAPFYDREKLRWVDPFKKEVWDYNIALAKAAADMGFDEVQFDYVRFPDTKGVTFSQPTSRETRTETISNFLKTAHASLAPSNIMVAADIFGYVPWNNNDTGIGQEIENAVNAVDVVSLMLYPSGFQFGIPNYRNPITNTYEIINLSLKRAQERTQVSPLRFRPWLQAFRDYAFGREQFGVEKMRLQIQATNNAGASGYMFWNPRNVYPDVRFVD